MSYCPEGPLVCDHILEYDVTISIAGPTIFSPRGAEKVKKNIINLSKTVHFNARPMACLIFSP